MPSATRPFSERKTIGVFASQVGRAWGAEFMAGITNAAEVHNVNLVHFIGGKLSPLNTAGEDKPSFGLYDLARPDQFDGLLLTTDVAYGVSKQDLESFTKVYGSVPIVTQSIAIPGTPKCILELR